MTTDVGRKFLNLVDSCFPPTNPLHKIFNRKTIKISHITMPSLGRILAGHNAKVIASKIPVVTKRPWLGQLQLPREDEKRWRVPSGWRVPGRVHCLQI